MKLSVKLALYIAALAIICSVVVAAISFISIQKQVDATVSKSVSALVRTVYSAAAKAAYTNDRELASEIVLGLQYNDEIACAEISTLIMDVGSDKGCEHEAYIKRKLISPVDASYFAGELRIYRNGAYRENLAKEQLLHELKSIVSVIIFVCLSLLVLTYFLIAKPISLVSAKLLNVQFDSDVDLLEEGSRSDELGDIGRVINLMLANAKKQIISEQIMVLRTEELSTHFKMIFELSKNYLAVTDGDLRLQSFNPKFRELVAHTRDPDTLMNKDDWLSCVTDDPVPLYQLIVASKEVNTPITRDMEFSYSENGELVHNFFNLTFVKGRTKVAGTAILIFINDMTDHRQKLLESEYEASHDNLTKLMNRLAATRRIRHILSSNAENEQTAIIFVDLDGFKEINDTLGHDAGDMVLRIVASRIHAAIRKTDVACRWGGDEFLIALSDVAATDALLTANKILTEIVKPISFPALCLTKAVGASIGVALSTELVSDFSTLYDCADRAMYQVKKSGKNAVLLYSR